MPGKCWRLWYEVLHLWLSRRILGIPTPHPNRGKSYKILAKHWTPSPSPGWKTAPSECPFSALDQNISIISNTLPWLLAHGTLERSSRWRKAWTEGLPPLQGTCTLQHRCSGPQWNQNIKWRKNWRNVIQIFHLLEKEVSSRTPDTWCGFCSQNMPTIFTPKLSTSAWHPSTFFYLMTSSWHSPQSTPQPLTWKTSSTNNWMTSFSPLH